jgi:hypothetical protein
MATLATAAKAQLIGAAFESILGSMPLISYTGNQAKISFTSDQSDKLREYVSAKMSDNTPSDIDLDLMPVVVPLVLKQMIPIALAILVVGYLAGNMGKKKKRG